MKYIVKIEERLVRTVTIEAKNEQEAAERAKRLHQESIIVLDVDDYEGEPHITCYGPTYARPELVQPDMRHYD